MNSFIRTPSHITVCFDDGTTATTYTTESHYKDVVDAIRSKDWDNVRKLMIPSVAVKQQLEQSSHSNRTVIEDGVVYLDGTPLHNTLTDRILSMLEEGFDIEPMIKFLENLMENPSYRAVNELYDFMEHSDLPITEDGHFIAYKRVGAGYKDIYTGTFDNSVGAVCEMPRNAVNEDKDRTCSEGLHFCSRSYLPHYGNYSGCHTMIVKINPRDVVAIPSDYNNAKGRCCRYEVIGELQHQKEENLEGSVYRSESSEPSNPSEPSFNDSSDGGVHLNADTFKNLNTTQPPTSTNRFLVQYNPDTNIVVRTFDSVKEAANCTGIDASSINKVCKGDRKTAGGYRWEYVSVASKLPTSTPRVSNRLLDDMAERDDSDYDPMYDMYDLYD